MIIVIITQITINITILNKNFVSYSTIIIIIVVIIIVIINTITKVFIIIMEFK